VKDPANIYRAESQIGVSLIRSHPNIPKITKKKGVHLAGWLLFSFTKIQI